MDGVPQVVTPDSGSDNSGDSILSTILGDGGVGNALTGLANVIGSLNGNTGGNKSSGGTKPPKPPAKPGSLGSFTSNPVYMIIGLLVIVGIGIALFRKK